MIKIFLLAPLGAALLAGAGLGLAARSSRPVEPSADAARAEIAANGITEGAREVLLLRSEVPGTIRVIRVRANQAVRQGDLLVELENATQRAQVRRAEALVRSREAECEKARDFCERARRSGTGTSTQDLRQAESALQKARADAEVAHAELDLAQAELAKTLLRAPWAGQVLRVYDEPGALVMAASPRPILMLGDVSKRRVRAFVEELDALSVREGQPAVVTIDGLPGQEFRGQVSGEILLRMDSNAPRSDHPGEYTDIHHRPVLIDLEGGQELPLNLRVQVRISAQANALKRP